MRTVLSVWALFACLTLARVAAQETTGDIRGRVVDTSGQPLTNVQVAVVGSSLQGQRQSLSNSHGQFQVLAVPPGFTTVQVTLVGYRPIVIQQVNVRLGQTTDIGVVTLAAELTELSPVIVVASPNPIDPMTATAASHLTRQITENLPVGRDYRSLLVLLPQANESFYSDGVNIAGGTGLENAYFVDGVNVTEPYRGDGGIDLPYNFIDHLSLSTGGYEADKGRALGGIADVVTRSGGDNPSVSGFGFVTDSRLATSPQRGLVDQGKGDYTRYDVGVSLGGPIERSRLWFFLAYDGAVERQHVQIPGSETALDHGITHKFAGKLTWRANSRTNLFLTAIGDPSSRDIVGNPFFAPFVPPASLLNPDPFLGYWNEGGVAVALRGDHRVGNGQLLATLAQTITWQQNGARTSLGRTEPLFSDDLTKAWSGGYGNRWDRTSTRLAASVAGNWVLGDHLLKAGAQYEDNRLRESWQWSSNGPDSAGWLERVDTNIYITLPLDFRTTVHNRVLSLFLQGSYLATPWLRLNPGIRWDGQFFSGPQGRTGSITDQLQPRVGIILYPGRSASQKVTASYGRFYEQLPNLTASFWWGGLYQEFPVYKQDPRADTTGRVAYPDSVRAVNHVQGQHFDELTLGYELQVGEGTLLRARGVYRTLRELLTTADSLQVDPNSPITLGANPGTDPLAFLPRPDEYYIAFELALQKSDSSRLNYQLSYVLSRHYGNYVGLYDQDAGVGNPNSGTNFSNPHELTNAKGLLPNDRTHVVKAFGSYRFGTRFTLGSYMTLQTGTPLNYWGAAQDPYAVDVVFLKPRGTAGRTTWLWDLNLRVSRAFGSPGGQRSSRITLDAFHLFSGKRPVLIDQKAFLHQNAASGAQETPNPTYGEVLLRQPPMSLRLGVEIAP